MGSPPSRHCYCRRRRAVRGREDEATLARPMRRIALGLFAIALLGAAMVVVATVPEHQTSFHAPVFSPDGASVVAVRRDLDLWLLGPGWEMVTPPARVRIRRDRYRIVRLDRKTGVESLIAHAARLAPRRHLDERVSRAHGLVRRREGGALVAGRLPRVAPRRHRSRVEKHLGHRLGRSVGVAAGEIVDRRGRRARDAVGRRRGARRARRRRARLSSWPRRGEASAP